MSEIEKLMQEAREIAVNYAMLHDHIAEKIVTLAYAAGRKAGREEAAALCDKIDEYDGFIVAGLLGAAIRALPEP